MKQLGYSVRREYVDEFYARHVATLARGSRVLDLGGHANDKRGYFDIGDHELDVVYANISTAKGTDVQALAEEVPFANDSFDAVICAELLEHVRDPRRVLSEAHRVLRNGGTLLMSAPFLFHIHADPEDYGRYTDNYWNATLAAIGFGDVAIERHGLYYSVLADFFKQHANQARIVRPLGRPLRWLWAHLFVLRFQHWARRHERKARVKANPFVGSFTTGYGIVATKSRA